MKDDLFCRHRTVDFRSKTVLVNYETFQIFETLWLCSGFVRKLTIPRDNVSVDCLTDFGPQSSTSIKKNEPNAGIRFIQEGRADHSEQFRDFIEEYGQIIHDIGLPTRYWKSLHEKLENEVFDAGNVFMLTQNDDDQQVRIYLNFGAKIIDPVKWYKL